VDPGRSAEAAGLAFGYGTNVKDIDAQLSAFGLKSVGNPVPTFPISTWVWFPLRDPGKSDTDVKPGMQMGQVPNGFKPLIQAVGGSVNSLLRSRDRCAAGLEGSSAQVLRA